MLHFLGAIGSCVTELEAEFNIDGIFKGILSGKTKCFMVIRLPCHLFWKEVIKKRLDRLKFILCGNLLV